jgi:hypothetical protein
MKQMFAEPDDGENSKEQLVNLLKRLGIKSADKVSLGWTMERLMKMMRMNTGEPDQLFMDPSSFKALSSMLSKADPKLSDENDES